MPFEERTDWVDAPRPPAKPGETPVMSADIKRWERAHAEAHEQLDGRLSEATLNSTYAPLGVAQDANAAYVMSTRGFTRRNRPVTKMVGFLSEPGHGWTAGGAGQVNLNDTTQAMMGSQSVAITPPVSGSSQVQKTDLSPFSVTGKTVRLVFRYTGDLTNVTVYFSSDSALTNRVQKNMFAASAHPPNVDNVVEMSIAEFTANGTPDLDAIVNCRVLVGVGAGGGTANIASVMLTDDAQSVLPTGAVTFSFDDTHADHWNYVRPKLAKYGYGATLYPVNSSFGGSAKYTVTQAQYMQNVHGFDVGSHASTPEAHATGMVGRTEAELRAEFEAIISANRANNLRGDSFAYPNTTSDDLARKIAADYFRSARGGSAVANEVFPPSDPMNLRAVNAGSYTLAQLKQFVDRAKSGHSWVHFFFHELPTTKVSGNDVARQDFYDLVDYVAAQQVPVYTVSQMMALPLN